MKNIVVPTDFSDNANNALEYAINLAIHFDSKIHLIHVFEVRTQTGVLVSIRDIMKKDAEEDLAKIIKEYKGRFIRNSSIEATAIEGYTYQTINSFAKGIGADFIVMGTQGASAVKGIFMGSNTSKVIGKSEIPVLSIPKTCSYHQIKDITLAVDDKVISSEDVLRPLTEFAKSYEAHISVLHVEKEMVASSAGVDAGIDMFLSEVPHTYNTVYSDSVKEGVDRFVDRVDADLLCMVHRERGFIGNLFHKSKVNTEVFDCKVPLLVVYDKY